MPEPRLCPDCGADISARHPNAKRCEECAHKRQQSQRNESQRARYARDPEFRAARAEYQREYRCRPGKREQINRRHRNWRNSRRGQATRRAYNQRPEVKARNAERMRERYVPRVPEELGSAIPSTLHPDVAGRTTRKPREYAADREAAAEPSPRECADCGRETPPSALDRNGGLCGFCAEFERRGRAA